MRGSAYENWGRMRARREKEWKRRKIVSFHSRLVAFSEGLLLLFDQTQMLDPMSQKIEIYDYVWVEKVKFMSFQRCFEYFSNSDLTMKIFFQKNLLIYSHHKADPFLTKIPQSGSRWRVQEAQARDEKVAGDCQQREENGGTPQAKVSRRYRKNVGGNCSTSRRQQEFDGEKAAKMHVLFRRQDECQFNDAASCCRRQRSA